MQRNFALRSRLITSPLPAVSGTALVPSTLDVYLNNVKTFSQEVPAGPYSVANLPVLSGGNARVVLRDATGREVETTMPFYSTPILLRSGLWDFSAEAGYPRLGYGTASDEYVRDAFASFSVRHGLLDTLTLEAHGEIGNGLYNGGIGLAALTGSFGVLSLAASGSQLEGQTGLQLFAAYETKILGMFFNFSSQRTFGSYDKLATWSWRPKPAPELVTAAARDQLAAPQGARPRYRQYADTLRSVEHQLELHQPRAGDRSPVADRQRVVVAFVRGKLAVVRHCLRGLWRPSESRSLCRPFDSIRSKRDCFARSPDQPRRNQRRSRRGETLVAGDRQLWMEDTR